MLNWQKFTPDAARDLALRRFLSSHGSGGARFQLRLSREPNFFDALSVEGTAPDVFGVEDADEVVALALRTEKQLFVNGEEKPKTLGYLGNLRIQERYQGSLLLQRGYRFLRKLHQEGKSEGYLTTILSNNSKATNVLTLGRGALPSYMPLGKFVTCLITPKKRQEHASVEYQSRKLTSSDFPLLEEFLFECRKFRNFFPSYNRKDLEGGGLLKGLRSGDLRIALLDGEIVGLLGMWDQSSFRQWHVDGPYINSASVRGLINLTRAFHGLPYCAGSHVPLPLWTGVLPITAPGHESAFAILLRDILSDLYSQNRRASLALGMHEDDPLLDIVARKASLKLMSDVYLVSWKEDQCSELRDDLVPYLELGGL